MRVANEIGLKELCPCGSQRKYKNCCRTRGFKFVRDSEGNVSKQLPLNDEMVQTLTRAKERKEKELGRPLGPGDHLFSKAEVDRSFRELRKILEGMGRPDLLYAFDKTGRIVTEDNQQFLSKAELKEWNDAVDEYRALHGT